MTASATDTLPRDDDAFRRSLEHAQIALSQMRALGHRATPPHYEVWYTYATGHLDMLNQTVNAMIEKGVPVTEADLLTLYETFLSPARWSDRIDRLGRSFKGELGETRAILSEAAENASSYARSLDGIDEQLAQPIQSGQLSSLVKTLLRETDVMRAANQSLQQRVAKAQSEVDGLIQQLETIQAETLTDPLTSLGNRKRLDSALAQAIELAGLSSAPLVLLMMDIDHFKGFNDTYGHRTGDQVLRLVAQTIRHHARENDTACRFGGEEFVQVMPDTTMTQAVGIAERIRRMMMAKELMKRSTGEKLGRITLSIGLAQWRPGESADEFIERADECLYAAKRAGRNRVIAETDMVPKPAVA